MFPLLIKSVQPINHTGSNDNNSSEAAPIDSQGQSVIDNQPQSMIDNHLQRIKALTKNVIRNFDDGKSEKNGNIVKCESPIGNLILVETNPDNSQIKNDQVKKANPIMAIENMVKNQVAKSKELLLQLIWNKSSFFEKGF